MHTSERLSLAMAELMRAQGYAATSIKQVGEAAGAPVGSIYHHYGDGKLGLAAAALRASGAVYIQLLPALLDRHDDLATAVEDAFATAADDLETTGWANMCPVGTVAGEVATAEPALREVVDGVFTHWVDVGTTYLAARGLDDADARALTYAILAALEGAFVLARTQRSREPLLAAGAATAAYAASLATARDHASSAAPARPR